MLLRFSSMQIATILAALLLVPATVHAEVGYVVLEDTPSCDYFVVETGSGYVLLEWYGGIVSVLDGDKVIGDLHSYGMKTIYVEGRGEMRVWIEDYLMDEEAALDYFYTNCG